ncbi:MAG: hypothetical protein LAP40_26805 [Acidobacteriia bacterium]|nr:hypothetical protein [Terriglobia bacterium]
MRVRLLVIALLGVMLASAKTYQFTVSDTLKAGSTQLSPGQYTLKLDGPKVILKDASGHDVPATAKVESGTQEFRNTEVSTTQANGSKQIEWIGLAGSKSKIVFQ